MLANRGSAAGEAEAPSVEDEEAVGDAAVHAVRHFGVAKSLARGEMIRREHLVGTQHRRHREAASLRLACELELGLVLEEIREHRIENVGLDRHAPEQVVEMIGLQYLRLAEPRAHRAPLARIQNDQAHVAVGARIHRVNRRRAHSEFEVLSRRALSSR